MISEWMQSAPRSERWILLMVLAGLGIVGFYLFVAEPANDRIQLLRHDVARVDQAIIQQRDAADQLPGLREEVRTLESALQSQAHSSAWKGQPIDIRHEVAQVAERHHLNLTVWKSGRPVPDSAGSLVKRSAGIQVEGGYHQVAQFLNQILQLPGVLSIPSLYMKKPIDLKQSLPLSTTVQLEWVDGSTFPFFAKRKQSPVVLASQQEGAE